MENQSEVKIIGLEVKEQFGFIKACKLKFDEKNKLVAIKGETGSGKTTLQKSLKLVTQGSDTLKDDKQLYGNINQEIQLLDGETNLYIGCRSDKNGNLSYSLYCKDVEGNKVANPIIDGVKATPAKYLQALQTELTWRAADLTSENMTVQRNILLKLFRPELEKVGVIFDPKSEKYEGSILNILEAAKDKRSQKDYARKQIGGYANQLKQDHNVDVENVETYPTQIAIEPLQQELMKVKFSIENAEKEATQEKEIQLSKLENQKLNIEKDIAEFNGLVDAANKTFKEDYDLQVAELEDSKIGIGLIHAGISKINSKYTTELSILFEKVVNSINETIIQDAEYLPKIQTTTYNGKSQNGIDLATKLELIDKQINDLKNKEIIIDNSENYQKITEYETNILQAQQNKKTLDAIDIFIEWRDADRQVAKLYKEYYQLLSSIKTGLNGMNITADEDGKIYLVYNGEYDTKYFNNPEKEFRKISSYSGTQKALITLLVQASLLNKKHKAMRYLWLDETPIDNKTRNLLEVMGEKLNVTIFVSITGDFERKELQQGEIFIEGGEVFFNE
ncbi:MAG: hypothetical protein HN704_14710 [Bacteroidetes bacterium]|nr:hypothetical protein [Bacteroidota bacterium]